MYRKQTSGILSEDAVPWKILAQDTADGRAVIDLMNGIVQIRLVKTLKKKWGGVFFK